MKKIFILTMVAILFSGMIGCSQKDDKNPSEVTESPTEEVEEYKVIGVESDDAYEMMLKNSIGKDIVDLSIKTTDKEEYPVNMIKNGEVIASGETVNLFYTPEKLVNDQLSDSDKAVNTIYEVKVVLADNTVLYISALGLDDINKEVELLYEDEVIFVKYNSKATGSLVSTKEQELGALQMRKDAEAKAKAEAEAAAKAAQEAATRAAAEQAAAEASAKAAQEAAVAQAKAEKEVVTEAPSSQQVEEQQTNQEVTNEQTAPEQHTDSCLGGAALN